MVPAVHRARSLITSLTHVDTDTVRRIDALVSEMVAEFRRDLENDRVPPERQGYQRFAECRYHGQGFELRADIPEGEVTAAVVKRIIENFHAQHRLDYDYDYAFDEG